VPSLSDRLRGRTWKTFLRALIDASEAGEEGDAALSEVIASLPKDRQSMAVAVMGDTRGEFGADALRRIIHSSDASPEARGTALIALAKRCRFAAADELVNALSSRDWRVQDVAVRWLAAVGDDRAWDQVFDRLERRLRSPPRQPVHIDNSRAEVTEALSYLLPHVDHADSQRKTKIVKLLRRRWHHLNKDEQAWLERYWPQSRPDGSAPESIGSPDVDAIRGGAAMSEELFDWGTFLRDTFRRDLA
jgi:HEAT repeat protein